MRRTIVLLIVGKISVLALSLVAVVGYLAVLSYQHYPVAPAAPAQRLIVQSAVPTLAVRSFAVFDAVSGEVLFSHAGDTPYPIASVTKLVSAAAAESMLPLEATTTLTWADVAAEGRAGKLAPTQEYSYRELLFPLLLESSNDAAAALERTGGGALVPAMNELAHSYGAASAHFADASGLSSKNVASAHDLAKLTVALRTKHPFIFDVTSLPQYIGEYTGWINNSPVIAEAAYRGGKHGYTEAAGRTIVALFDEEFPAGSRTLGYVVLGSENVRGDVAMLRQFVHEAVELQ